MERSFAAEVKQLAPGEGQILRGEGILAITKALLQSGVSYVGGYPGAPVSHLLDVLADANEALLKPMGVYLDASAEERARRRANDAAHTGGKDSTLAGVQQDLVKRDASDRSRPVAPLAVASDAIYVDTTGMTISDVVERVMGIVKDKVEERSAG